MNLKDKNVGVTGGSRGLGLGVVEALAARGARTLCDRRRAAGAGFRRDSNLNGT